VRFADANIFLRYLAQPVTAIDQARFEACDELFQRVMTGEEQITTSEVTLAEVFFVLTSPRHYRLSTEDAVARLEPIVQIPDLVFPQKSTVLRAYALLQTHPMLGFEDAFVAAMLQDTEMPLLSYDSDFDRIPGIVREEP